MKGKQKPDIDISSRRTGVLIGLVVKRGLGSGGRTEFLTGLVVKSGAGSGWPTLHLCITRPGPMDGPTDGRTDEHTIL